MLGAAALIGADARVPSMVLQRAPLGQRGSSTPPRSERRAVPGLGDLRADRDRDRRRTALSTRSRLPGRVGVEARLRRHRRRAGVDGADRVRSALRPQVRDLGSRRLGRLSAWWILGRRRSRRALVGGRRPRGLVLARRRHRDRGHRLLGAARRGLLPLLARPEKRVYGSAWATCCPTLVQLASARCSSSSRGVDRTSRS